MVSVVPASQITLDEVESRFGLTLTRNQDFCPEFQLPGAELIQAEQDALDRVQSNFLTLLKRSQVLEDIVKMVVLSPLMDLAGFYTPPYKIEAETSVELAIPDRDEVIRGRIDVLVLNRQLWLLVIESKRASLDVITAVPQALVYMQGNPSAEHPSYGLITNGNTFLFVKLVQQPQPRYGFSRLFSLVNPGNDLWEVLKVLKTLGATLEVNSQQ
jgi:hypothetical protein